MLSICSLIREAKQSLLLRINRSGERDHGGCRLPNTGCRKRKREEEENKQLYGESF